MMLQVLLAIVLVPDPYQDWPVGYFDVAGEMTYQEAASAIGVRPPDLSRNLLATLEELKKDRGNYVLWKVAVDKCIAEQGWKRLYDFCTAASVQPKKPTNEYWEALNGMRYALQSAKEHLDDGGLNLEARTKWLTFLKNNTGGFGTSGTNPSKSQMLTLLTRPRVSVKNWQDLIAKYEGKINCRYYFRYMLSESYLITEIPVGSNGKAVGVKTVANFDKAISEYKKTHELFPMKPTPCYWLAALSALKDPAASKAYAKKYVALENRPFKVSLKVRLTDYVRTGTLGPPKQ